MALVKSGQSVTACFVTPGPGAILANADSTPTAKVVINGADNAASVTVTNKTTGDYKAAVTLPSLSAGDIVQLRANYVMSGSDYAQYFWEATGDTVRLSDTLTANPASGGITSSSFGTGAITATAIAADAITDAKVASDVTIASVTGAVGSVTGAVGSVGSGGITSSSFASGAITAASIATDAIGSAELAATAANKIADHVYRRSWATAAASADGDTKSFRSLLGAIAKLVNKAAISGSTLTIYEDDDSTALGSQAVTTNASADPISALDTA